MGGEHAVGVAEFAHGRLDDSNIPACLDIFEQLKSVLYNIGYEIFIVATAFVGDQLLDPFTQCWVWWRLVRSLHGRERLLAVLLNATLRR